jgi:adenosylcobinamide-GDP ribazoletransferase
MEPLLTAVGFLTRIPVGRRGGQSDVADATPWFPLVGAFIGALVGVNFVVVERLVSPLAAAAVAVTVGALVTGGFHEDGLGDTADGFGGGWNVEQRLAIMDDSRQGTYGVLAIACSLIIRVAALSAFSGSSTVAVVAGVHLLARNWAVLALALARPARSEGLAHATTPSLTADRSRLRLILAALVWFGLGLALVGPACFLAVSAAGMAASIATVILSYRKIGGVTGDVLGTVEQLAEVMGLVAAAGAWARWGVW